MSISVKCSGQFEAEMGDIEYDGDIPRDIGLGGGDYMRFDYCLDCGQIQGDFALPLTDLEESIVDEKEYDDDGRYTDDY
jgi:hypothetical protein